MTRKYNTRTRLIKNTAGNNTDNKEDNVRIIRESLHILDLKEKLP